MLLPRANSIRITGCSVDHNFGPGIAMRDSIANTISGCNGAQRWRGS
ncbi:MAG TPA: hypothetical protein DCR55_08285 [Lentisphaeria bacterium]|nr:hypothetical protein [Lentisphaeria bacterium]